LKVAFQTGTFGTSHESVICASAASSSAHGSVRLIQM
jgi:hypothetical protein